MMKYPNWSEGTPHTDYNAKISKYRLVDNVRAIEVFKASYRGATFDGIFELENQNINIDPIIEMPSGKTKVKVICSWYGVKPPTTFPKIDLTNVGSYKILDNYSGEVVDNIGE
jgi:hypothetical protein